MGGERHPQERRQAGSAPSARTGRAHSADGVCHPPVLARQTAMQRMADASPAVGALVALQRLTQAPSAASRAPVQLRKYSDKEIRAEIKFVLDGCEPNKTSILLAVYNQIRLTLDPDPGPFQSVKKASDALVAAERFDADDVEAFAEEAGRLQTAGGNPAEATRLRIRETIATKRGAIAGKYAHHIFDGDMKDGVPTGYHSKAGNSASHEAYGTSTDVGNAGAYQQSVRTRDDHVRKPIQSTFFPDTATRDTVIDALTVVYEAGLSTVAYVDDTVNGMRLAKRGDTVFPAGGSDARRAE